LTDVRQPPAVRRERAGLLIIRVWLESDTPDGLRARITRTLDVERGPGEERISTASKPEEICATVSDWLREFSSS
jgi:hypothetical protein